MSSTSSIITRLISVIRSCLSALDASTGFSDGRSLANISRAAATCNTVMGCTAMPMACVFTTVSSFSTMFLSLIQLRVGLLVIACPPRRLQLGAVRRRITTLVNDGELDRHRGFFGNNFDGHRFYVGLY